MMGGRGSTALAGRAWRTRVLGPARGLEVGAQQRCQPGAKGDGSLGKQCRRRALALAQDRGVRTVSSKLARKERGILATPLRCASATGQELGSAKDWYESARQSGTSDALDVGSSNNYERLRPNENQNSIRRRPKIAVDVDEVLAQFLLSLNAYYEERFGTKYDIGHYDKYYFCKVWGVTPDASNDIVHDFFDSTHFTSGVVPVPGALEALRVLKDQGADLVVVTSRQFVIQDQTNEWLQTHFGDLFQEVHFANHFAKDGKSEPKSKLCERIGADVLIDDNPQYAMECASAGMSEILLFDWESKYPWSKDAGIEQHENIVQVSNWNQVQEHLHNKFLTAKPQLPPL
mmetsp:Transcript_15220/g.38697  ORF Transcript_15220/g.38697 Transcript_15220/m.38697 type:complete len:346 (+) Transcript_15220:114-1151(+)